MFMKNLFHDFITRVEVILLYFLMIIQALLSDGYLGSLISNFQGQKTGLNVLIDVLQKIIKIYYTILRHRQLIVGLASLKLCQLQSLVTNQLISDHYINQEQYQACRHTPDQRGLQDMRILHRQCSESYSIHIIHITILSVCITFSS